MEILIKRIDEETIKIIFGNDFLEISQTSESWNNKGINAFLINIVTNNPNNSKLEVKYDKKLIDNDDVYTFTVNLFENFINEINKSIFETIIVKESEKIIDA